MEPKGLGAIITTSMLQHAQRSQCIDGIFWFPTQNGPFPKTIINSLPVELSGTKEGVNMASLIDQINMDIQDTKDALAATKVTQAYYASAHHGIEDTFAVSDLMMLPTSNCQ